MRLFWWDRVPNIGDRISAMLLRHHGQEVQWSPPREADWVAAGSVLEHFDGFTGTVWGTGRAGPHSPPTDLSAARVLALRGKDTLALAKTENVPVLGDPGILACDLVKQGPRDSGYTAIVPHWQDQERMRETYREGVFVDVVDDVLEALRLISGASRVVSSSLHGIVFADSYGVTRMWDWFDGVQARGFKFRDYGTVLGSFEPGEWYKPDPGLVKDIKDGLRGCLTL